MEFYNSGRPNDNDHHDDSGGADWRTLVMLLELEAVCRTIKNQLRGRLRERVRSMKSLEQEGYKLETIEFFNIVVGSRGEDSERYWQVNDRRN